MTTPADEDEMTELVDADFPIMAAVGKGANGIPRFLISKQDGGGLMDPEFVRDLIAKAEPESTARERVTMPSGLTLTGSPADIAAFIHKAAAGSDEPGDVAKAKNDAASRKHAAATGAAMKDGSYPIENEADLGKAIRAVGRGGASHGAIRKHIISRAKSLGASSKIPDNWAADGSLKEDSVSKSDTVAKDMGPELDEGIDGMDPTIPLAAPDEDAPGDPTDPGSPAWEAIDAATACKWTSILARAKVAVGVLADREMLEAASADPDDAGNACDLDDVCCAIDYAISVLAPYAVAEQSESDCGAADMDAISKAMAGFDPGPLEAVEALASVRKAGRVLSAANEAAIRGAAESLNTVLASLPQAPVADDPVTKEAAMAAETTTEAAPAETEVAKAEETPEAQEPAQVAKADGDAGKAAQVAVYDSSGNLVGVADPADITPLANVAAPAKGDDPDEAAAAPPADPAPAETPADPADMTPEPSAAAGTPADADDDVAKAATGGTTTDEHEVLKSLVTDAVTAALGTLAPVQDIAKQADVIRELSEQVETLKGQVETLGEQPAMPKVFTSGATPPANLLRGQDKGAAQPVDVAKAAELKHTLYKGTGPEQKQAFDEMQQMAVDGLAALYSR